MSNPNRYNIDTNAIQLGIEAGRRDIQNPTFAQNYTAGISQQKQLELAFLADYKVCPDGIDTSKVAQHLASLDAQALTAEIKDNFYNAEVMKAAACIASSLIIDQGPYALAGNERVREFISGLRQIGSESVFGYALSADLGDKTPEKEPAKGAFVVKAPRNPIRADELVHEVFIGTYGTNQLRSLNVPHFAWIYGMFNCSPPFIDSSDEGKKKVVAWCNSTTKNAVVYAIYENLAPAKSFGDMAQTATPEAFMKRYLSLLLGLRAGVKLLGYTHYDLHSGNALDVERFNGRFYIPMETLNGIEYVESDGTIPTIIDEGNAHIQMRGTDGRLQHFGFVSEGAENLTMFGIYRDRAHPMHDAYKLLCFCLYDMLSPAEGKSGASNPDTYMALAPLLRFFNNSEDINALLVAQRQLFFSLPYTAQTSKLALDDWIDYCRKFCVSLGFADPIKPQLPPGAVVLQCSGDCLNFTQELTQVAGIRLNEALPTPSTFLEFYDAYGTIASQQLAAYEQQNKAQVEVLRNTGTDLARQFKAKFEAAYNFELKRLDNLSKDLASFVVYRLPRNHTYLLNPTVLNQVKMSTTRTIKFLDAYQRMSLSVKAIRYIAQIYATAPDYPLNKLGDYYQRVLDNAKPFRDSLVEMLQQDVLFLEPWRADTSAAAEATQDRIILRRLIQQVKSDPRLDAYQWYWVTYPSALSMA